MDLLPRHDSPLAKNIADCSFVQQKAGKSTKAAEHTDASVRSSLWCVRLWLMNNGAFDSEENLKKQKKKNPQ